MSETAPSAPRGRHLPSDGYEPHGVDLDAPEPKGWRGRSEADFNMEPSGIPRPEDLLLGGRLNPYHPYHIHVPPGLGR